MPERVKLGVRVRKDVWDEFKQDVVDREGQKRGVLGKEVETALRQYLYTGAQDTPAEYLRDMNERLERIEDRVAPAETDGGTPHRPRADRRTDTHTSVSHPPHNPPNPRAPVADKAAWLAAQVDGMAEFSVENDLGHAAVDAWAFADDTHDRVVSAALDRLDHVPHPSNDDLYVVAERHETLLAGRRERTREQAADTLDACTAADTDA